MMCWSFEVFLRECEQRGARVQLTPEVVDNALRVVLTVTDEDGHILPDLAGTREVRGEAVVACLPEAA